MVGVFVLLRQDPCSSVLLEVCNAPSPSRLGASCPGPIVTRSVIGPRTEMPMFFIVKYSIP